MRKIRVMERSEPKIILFDLETLPNLREAMKVWPGISNYPGLTLRASINSMICCGYKVFGEPGKPKCLNAWDYKGWKKNVNDDFELVRDVRELLFEADAVVTHNGKRFDWKFLQTRLLVHGLAPLPKIRHIDTCAVAKANTMFFNNRLNTLGEFVGKDKKIDNGGWELWERVMDRETKALKEMTDYCIHDVVVLEKVFRKMRPLVSEIPNYNLFKVGVDKDLCPKCGSSRLWANGFRSTATTLFKRFQCQDCGSCCQQPAENKVPRSF